MSPTAKITTYACFFGIIILFLYLGYASIGNIKSVKLDPETFYLAKLIDNGQELCSLSEHTYKTLQKKANTNPNIPVTIKDSDGELEEYTQLEIVSEELERKLRKAKQLQRFIDKFEEQEFADKYEKAISKFNEASEIMIWVCEEALDDMNNDELSTQLVPRFNEFKIKLGQDGSKIKDYIQKANSNLKR